MARQTAIEQRAVRELRRALAGVFAPFALQKHGTDFVLRPLSGSRLALRVELKALNGEPCRRRLVVDGLWRVSEWEAALALVAVPRGRKRRVAPGLQACLRP